jgi:hypothetical protein
MEQIKEDEENLIDPNDKEKALQILKTLEN